MFGKKPPSQPASSGQPNQSQSLSNVTLNGGMVQMGQAGSNLQQNQTGDLQTQQQGITAAQVVSLLEQLEAAIKGANLEPAQQEKLLDYLRPAKREATKEAPSKELVGYPLAPISPEYPTRLVSCQAKGCGFYLGN
jgi:hypothetical protein